MIEKKPFFSVLIPLYHKQNHVKETIETVLQQTFQDFEIVVVNDGSKDESVQVVETIKDERIRLMPNYFESVVKGELIVWTSATCIPKKCL